MKALILIILATFVTTSSFAGNGGGTMAAVNPWVQFVSSDEDSVIFAEARRSDGGWLISTHQKSISSLSEALQIALLMSKESTTWENIRLTDE